MGNMLNVTQRVDVMGNMLHVTQRVDVMGNMLNVTQRVDVMGNTLQHKGIDVMDDCGCNEQNVATEGVCNGHHA